MACDIPLRDVPSLSHKETVLMIIDEEMLSTGGISFLFFTSGLEYGKIS